MFFSLQNHALFLRLRTNPGGPGWARWAFLFFFRVLFLLPLRGVMFGSLSGGRGFFFLLSGVECLRVERAGGRSSARTRVVRFFSCCQEGAWPGGWQDGRGFFFGRGSLFFPCPPGGGLGGEPQARSSSFAFFSRFLRRSRRPPPLQAPEGGGVQLRQGAFFPLRFSFFFRLPGRTGRALSSP